MSTTQSRRPAHAFLRSHGALGVQHATADTTARTGLSPRDHWVLRDHRTGHKPDRILIDMHGEIHEGHDSARVPCASIDLDEPRHLRWVFSDDLLIKRNRFFRKSSTLALTAMVEVVDRMEISSRTHSVHS